MADTNTREALAALLYASEEILLFEDNSLPEIERFEAAKEAARTALATQPAQPLLVRDVAEMLGIDSSVPVCKALVTLGYPQRSVNMAVTPDEAVAVAKHLAAQPSAQGVSTELTTKRIEEIAFAVLRSHNDDRLWRALTYDSGPYDVTKATLALQDLASAFFRAGLASAPAAPAQAVTDAQINGAIRAQQFWRIAAQESGFTFGPELHDFARAVLALASAPAAPAQAVALTDEQMEAGMRSFDWGPVPHPFRTSVAFERGVRFAESHHGIAPNASQESTNDH